MHTKTQKKHTPPKTAAIRLTLKPVHKTTRPLPKFRAAKPTQQIATREQIELPQYHIYIDNTFRACDKDSPDKKPRARLIYITSRVNRI